MVLSTETFNQSVRTEYSEAVNVCYTFQPLWVSDNTAQKYYFNSFFPANITTFWGTNSARTAQR